ncbi:MAG TPA: Gfo/Idh/MocA family oxidoreductase [Acidimicrobiales bacterium]|nr:Gfo/Idh/MocA family oxidoreductase [Acidimicrobiales bacterium]
MSAGDGASYAPSGSRRAVVGPGELRFAALGLDHGHINGMCNGLTEAGAELALVYDPDPAKVAALCAQHPGAEPAASAQQVLDDPSIALVASAAVPADRAGIGLRVLAHGKDYFVDKPPLTSLDQLEAVRAAVASTGRRYAVYYSERLHVECAVFAGQLVAEGRIGRVVQVLGLGPHRMNARSRPEWHFRPARTGGILCDIGSHQVEQFLYYTGARGASVTSSRVANYHNPEHPLFEDFGDCCLVADNGAVGYFRVDWLTPDGLASWGDGRTVLLGTEGYIELRKYLDVARDPAGDQLYVVDGTREEHLALRGKVGFPFFGELVLDCLERTERSMSQEHAFRAIELAITAEQGALRLGALAGTEPPQPA